MKSLLMVALRKESVDRNFFGRRKGSLILVALRKESVDRNTNPGSTTLTFPGSLSARRAWIEIPHTSHDFHAPKVALRKESVDRNFWYCLGSRVSETVALRKESVDRNILPTPTSQTSSRVALRKESVDRNF